VTGVFARLGRILRPVAPIADDEWRALLRSSALFDRLADDERARLREHTAWFLARKAFSAAGGHPLERAHCVAIAALACLPALHLGVGVLGGWREVIVYPGEFRVKREHHDEHSGVVTEGEDELIGEAWERGPLILSWADVATDLAHPFDGFNVVVHEIAHKLDLLDGAMNGTPALPPTIARRDWTTAMQAGYDRLARELRRGRTTFIDPYASESADEYFAVVSELHFSDPDGLAAAEPAVATLLRRYYAGGGDPDAATPVALARSDR
jgi:Mlc titration factor MtfA (ptsG expression regulator)